MLAGPAPSCVGLGDPGGTVLMAGGRVTVNCVLLSTVKLVAAAPPTSTAFTFGLPEVPKPEPVTVTVKPPVTEPKAGLTLVTAGGCNVAA